jgi:endoglucanase
MPWKISKLKGELSMKRIISLLLVMAMVIGLVPSTIAVHECANCGTDYQCIVALSTPAKTNITSLTYNFIAAGVTSPTSVEIKITGPGGWPPAEATTNVTADGAVSFNFTGINMGGLGNVGFTESAMGSVTLEFVSMVVNGIELTVVNEFILSATNDGLPNQWWDSLDADYILAANADDSAFLKFGEYFEFFSTGTGPVTGSGTKTNITSLTYNFTAAGVTSPTDVSFAVMGFNGYPERDTTTNIAANGAVAFEITGISMAGMGGPGFAKVITGSTITLEAVSIVVNGSFTLLPNFEILPPPLTVGIDGSNSFPNQWGGVTAGMKLAASADGSSYLEFVDGEGWVFFAGTSDPVSKIMSTSRSIDYAHAMGNGWNLGNTLDGFLADADYEPNNVASWETAWGNPQATQALITSIKARGFDHIRIPFSIISRSENNIIDADWLARYVEVVQWAVDAGLYVMINIHHDSWFWLGRNHGNNPMSPGWNGAVTEPHYIKFCAYWEQIAKAFADMPDTVMFETINEPEFNAAQQYGTTAAENHRRLNVINQAAYDIIRATPGNENRMIIIPTYMTNHAPHNSAPARDFIAGLNDENIIVTVHYYSEWVFSNHLGRMLFDEPIFNQYDPDDDFTARKSADEFFQIIYNHFISRGIGVSVGEWGLLAYDTDATGANSLQRGEELKYYEYIQHMARQMKGVSLSFWDNGSGIDRRSTNLTWRVPRVGAMLESKVRSSYSTGLDTIYLAAAPTAAVTIPLTLNGNTFTGVQGLTQGADFTFANGVLTLTQAYVTSRFNAMQIGDRTTLVLSFSAGQPWEVYLIKVSPAASAAATGTRAEGITIPINYRGNHIHRIQAFRGTAPATLTGLLDVDWTTRDIPQGIHVGGDHTEWFPYLEYGNAYRIDYAAGSLRLMPNFFTDTIQNGANVVVIEFLNGARLDITLTVTGNNVTAAAAGGPPAYQEPAVTTPPVTTPTEPGGTTAPPSTGTTVPSTGTNEPTTTTPGGNDEPILLGDVDGNGTVTITDALEILMYLAGMESDVSKGGRHLQAAMILDASVTAGKPSISDALEILMFLAGMESQANKLR